MTIADRFHPSNTKLLACAIDTEGYLGIWDIKEIQEDGEPSVYQYKPHTRTVTDMHFKPTDHSKLITSSYDGFIKTYDMNKAEFDTLDLGSTKFPVTGFDLTQDGNTVMVKGCAKIMLNFLRYIALFLYFRWRSWYL